MRFCRLKVLNLVLKIDLVNRRSVAYSREYGMHVNIENIVLPYIILPNIRE